jgi:hypothetical protein
VVRGCKGGELRESASSTYPATYNQYWVFASQNIGTLNYEL